MCVVTVSGGGQELSGSAVYGCRFQGREDLTEVVLPEGVTEIEGGLGLRQFTETERSAGLGGAFEGCSSLARLVLPSTLVAVGAYSFRGCIFISWFWVVR